MPTESEIEAEAKKQCLRAFEPYTYGPYFDALRDECRRKARETLEARERAKEYAVISVLKERPKMKEEVLNTSLRKFLKTVGVTSQREICARAILPRSDWAIPPPRGTEGRGRR